MKMSISIVKSDNPYVLDYIEEKNTMPALTRKNADFIEAVVRLDSNYAKDILYNPPSDGYDPEMNVSDSGGKFCGSSEYWFKEMMKESEYYRCLLGAVIAVDTTNSTHLEACLNGRKTVCDIIYKCAPNVESLIDKLNEPFNPNNKEHLISLISKGLPAKGKVGLRYNISFATKFCAYAANSLDASKRYSKYDDVVSDALPEYSKVYLNEPHRKSQYKIMQHKQKKMNELEKHQYRLDVFGEYSDCIKRILEKIDYVINRDELDHIIWYAYKGDVK